MVVAALLGVVGSLLSVATNMPVMLRIPNSYSVVAVIPTIAMGRRVCNGLSKKS